MSTADTFGIGGDDYSAYTFQKSDLIVMSEEEFNAKSWCPVTREKPRPLVFLAVLAVLALVVIGLVMARKGK